MNVSLKTNQIFVKLKDTISEYLLFLRFLKFGIVGASGFIIDTSLYFILQVFGLNHSVSRIISYWCAATNNWYWNREFTFKDINHKTKIKQWLQYMIMCFLSFILNWGSYHWLTSNIDFFIQYKFIAMLLGISVGMVMNFAIANLIIFKNKKK
jgi:putative flippase GtrA